MTDVTARFGRKKIQRSTSFDRFQKMRQAGAGFGDAMVAVWQGKEMTTEAEAATCIQRWWRACSCIKRFQESRKAVTAIQAGYRGMSVRLCLGMSDVSLSQVCSNPSRPRPPISQRMAGVSATSETPCGLCSSSLPGLRSCSKNVRSRHAP